MNKAKTKRRAVVLDLAQSILIHMDHSGGRNFHPKQLAERFGTTIGAIRTAMRELVVQGKAYQAHARGFFDRGPSKGGWMKHVFVRREI